MNDMTNTNSKSNLFRAMAEQKRTNNQLASAMRGAGIHRESPGQLKDLANIGVDGVDHINISDPGGVTELGKFLAHNADTPITHPLLGKFASVESLWHWVKSESRSDAYRTLFGKKLRTALKQDQAMAEDLRRRGMVKNFRSIICDANWLKIQQYPALGEELMATELPLDIYYVSNASERNRPVFASWVVRGFEEIRRALKEDREPDFTWALDHQDEPDVYVDELQRLEKIKAQVQASHQPAKPKVVADNDDIDVQALIEEAQAA